MRNSREPDRNRIGVRNKKLEMGGALWGEIQEVDRAGRIDQLNALRYKMLQGGQFVTGEKRNNIGKRNARYGGQVRKKKLTTNTGARRGELGLKLSENMERAIWYIFLKYRMRRP